MLSVIHHFVQKITQIILPLKTENLLFDISNGFLPRGFTIPGHITYFDFNYYEIYSYITSRYWVKVRLIHCWPEDFLALGDFTRILFQLKREVARLGFIDLGIQFTSNNNKFKLKSQGHLKQWHSISCDSPLRETSLPSWPGAYTLPLLCSSHYKTYIVLF